MTNSEKMRQTMIKKHGSLEAWKQHMSENGKKGGTISRRTMTTEEARRIGKLGGRPKHKIKEDL